MNWLTQIIAVTMLNLKSLPQRLAPSLVSIAGVAAVVMVFAAVLSMAKGFEKTMQAAGSDSTAIVLRSGVSSELSSGISSEQVNIISNAPGVLRDGDKAVLSAELYVLVDLEKKSTSDSANVPLRGVQLEAFDVRDNVTMVEGRKFEPGKNEFVVGRAAQQEFKGLDVGNTIQFGLTQWQVVGVFEADGSVSESELWADVRTVQGAYRRGNSFQSVRVKLESGEGLEELRQTLLDDPRIDPDVYSEKVYYSDQAEPLARFIRIVGYPLTIIMAIGAIFGALNTMYSSVAARGKEIATLRSLGFRPLPVMISTLVESTVLAFIGGILGGGLAYVIFNGYRVSTLNGASFSQVIFDFAVTPDLLIQGLVAALAIGFFGGLLPAIRAVRIPVNQALREL